MLLSNNIFSKLNHNLINTIFKEDECNRLYSIIYNISDLNESFYNMSLIPNMSNIYIDINDILDYFNLPNIFNLQEEYIEMLYDLAIYYSQDVHSYYNLNYNQDPTMFKNNYYIENYNLFYIVDYFNKLIGFDFHIEDDNFIITPINR